VDLADAVNLPKQLRDFPLIAQPGELIDCADNHAGQVAVHFVVNDVTGNPSVWKATISVGALVKQSRRVNIQIKSDGVRTAGRAPGHTFPTLPSDGIGGSTPRNALLGIGPVKFLRIHQLVRRAFLSDKVPDCKS